MHGTPHNIWKVHHNPSNTGDGDMVEKDKIEDAFHTVYNKGFSEVPCFLDELLSENLQKNILLQIFYNKTLRNIRIWVVM